MKLKVGDIVYFAEPINHSSDKIAKDVITEIDETNGGYGCVDHWFTDDDIGVIVFLTHEEAYNKCWGVKELRGER